MREVLWHALKRKKIWEYGPLILAILWYLFQSLSPEWDPVSDLVPVGFFSVVQLWFFFLDVIAEMDHTDKTYLEADIVVSKYGKVLERVPYDNVGAIVMGTHFAPGNRRTKYIVDFRYNRYQAAVAVYVKTSKILSRMTPRTKIGTDRISSDDAFDTFVFDVFRVDTLIKILENTGCGLYITDQIFEWYERDLARVVKKFESRMLICCYDEDGKTIFYTYHDYKLIVNNASLQ